MRKGVSQDKIPEKYMQKDFELFALSPIMVGLIFCTLVRIQRQVISFQPLPVKLILTKEITAQCQFVLALKLLVQLLGVGSRKNRARK